MKTRAFKPARPKGWKLLLCGLGCMILLPQRAAGREAPNTLRDHPTAVWIDTDPACGRGELADVDDCWAIVLALSSPELAVRGFSTVFGNVDGETAFAVARSLVSRVEGSGTARRMVYEGAGLAGGGAGTPATAALAAALTRERLTIVALGPLTNLAGLVVEHPGLVQRIDRIVAVAGTRPGARRLFPGSRSVLHFHDRNFLEDPDAFETVLEAGVPIVLLPFEAAQLVTVVPEDLDLLSTGGETGRSLATASERWLRLWRQWFGTEGFHPFDALAVGYVVDPGVFDCDRIPVRVARRRSLFVPRASLEASQTLVSPFSVTYCTGVSSDFKPQLLGSLASVEAAGR